MDKTVITKDKIREAIQDFYSPKVWHFMMINGTDTGEGLEIQWVFSKFHEIDVVQVFTCSFGYDEAIPSIKDIIPVAWVSEAENKDLLGANFEDTATNIFLEEDAPKTPLRKNHG